MGKTGSCWDPIYPLANLCLAEVNAFITVSLLTQSAMIQELCELPHR